MPILFLVVFIDLVGFGIIIPLLPFFGEFFGATPAQVGLLMATYSLTQFVSAPLWGHLSDRVGRRPVLLLSLAGAAVAYTGLAFADSLWMLFAARAFGGAMAGNISAAFAYAADITTPANRARGMGIVGASFGLGFIFGPAIGGLLAGPDPMNADYQTPALTAAALSVVALVLAVFRLEESLSAEARARQRALPRESRRRQLAEALAGPNVVLLIVMSFVATFVFAGMESIFAMWSRRQLDWGPQQNGYLFAFVGLISAAIQGGLVGRLARLFGEGRLILQGSVALMVGMAVIPFSESAALLIVAMVIVSYGFALMTPALNSMISLAVGAESQGGVMGVTRSVTTLARVFGPSGAGALFHYLGRDWPFFAGSVLMAVLAVMALKTIRVARGPTRS